MDENKKYQLDETNRRRLNSILANALTIGSVLYTEDEKRRVDQKTLQKVVNRAILIQKLAQEVAREIGVEIYEDINGVQE